MGTYGVDAGTYIVLPIYNATTPRQLTGAVVDAAYTYPFWNWVGGPWSLVKYGVQAVDKRSKTLIKPSCSIKHKILMLPSAKLIIRI